MNKIIGLINAWAAEDWIEPAIQQALLYCDEVIVSVGAHSTDFKYLEDSTLQRVTKYQDKIKIVSMSKAGLSHNDIKANTLNRMLKQSSLFKQDNWIWILDVDEFYFNATHLKIKEIIKNNIHDCIRIEAKLFYINGFRYLCSSHDRLFKITNSACCFKPTQHWTGSQNKKFILKRDNHRLGMFHYCLLTGLKYKELLWESHLGRHDEKILWLREIYIKYDLNNEDLWINKNLKISGIKSPFYNNQFQPDQNGYLFVYMESHPSFINHLMQKEDFR